MKTNEDKRVKRKNEAFKVMNEELELIKKFKKTDEYRREFKLSYIDSNFGYKCDRG